MSRKEALSAGKGGIPAPQEEGGPPAPSPPGSGTAAAPSRKPNPGLPEGWSRNRARHLLIALNASGLSRDAVCRLARRLDEIADLDDGEEPSLEPGLSPGALAAARKLVAHSSENEWAEVSRQEEEQAAACDARILTLLDSDYPASLRDLELPPPVLYLRGQVPPSPAIAIVGSRNADPYGLEASRLFASELASAGATVVSGFARGVDATAHRAALDQEAGTTVAVLGCGLGVEYPRHYRMLDEIAERGAALSEFPCKWGPKAPNFPIRNRLIAALSCCTLVIQAASRSGALITARLAAELGRDVFAVPGRIFEPRSQGANALLRDGALVALDPRSVLEGLPLAAKDRLREIEQAALGTSLQRRVTKLLERGAATSEELARSLGHTVEEVLVALLELELRGNIERYGPRFGLRR